MRFKPLLLIATVAAAVALISSREPSPNVRHEIARPHESLPATDRYYIEQDAQGNLKLLQQSPTGQRKTLAKQTLPQELPK